MSYAGANILSGAAKSDTVLISRGAVIQGFITDANCPTTTLKIKVMDGTTELPLYKQDNTEFSMNVAASRAYMLSMDTLAFSSIKFLLGANAGGNTVIRLVVKDA